MLTEAELQRVMHPPKFCDQCGAHLDTRSYYSTDELIRREWGCDRCGWLERAWVAGPEYSGGSGLKFGAWSN